MSETNDPVTQITQITVPKTKAPKTRMPYLTPAKAQNNRLELRPLPLRVAGSQYHRLDEARNRTGISIQEHVRRAIDLYLATIEREAIELGLLPERTLSASGLDRNPKQDNARSDDGPNYEHAPIAPAPRRTANAAIRKR